MSKCQFCVYPMSISHVSTPAMFTWLLRSPPYSRCWHVSPTYTPKSIYVGSNLRCCQLAVSEAAHTVILSSAAEEAPGLTFIRRSPQEPVSLKDWLTFISLSNNRLYLHNCCHCSPTYHCWQGCLVVVSAPWSLEQSHGRTAKKPGPASWTQLEWIHTQKHTHQLQVARCQRMSESRLRSSDTTILPILQFNCSCALHKG